MHKHKHTYTHKHMCVHTLYTSTCTHISTCTHTNTHAHTYTSAHVHKDRHAYMQKHISTHVHIQACVNAHTHTSTHMYTYTHTRIAQFASGTQQMSLKFIWKDQQGVTGTHWQGCPVRVPALPPAPPGVSCGTRTGSCCTDSTGELQSLGHNWSDAPTHGSVCPWRQHCQSLGKHRLKRQVSAHHPH